MKKMIKAIYAGTFDSITNGHLDIIKRSMSFCTDLVIGIGINPAKKTMFSEAERIKQINCTIEEEFDFLVSTQISVVPFQGLLVDFAKSIGASVLIRGIRSVSDFEYEITLANTNKILNPNIETVFLPTSPELAIVSSSMVKEIAHFGGDISRFVPKHIAKDIKAKFGFIKLST